ncbi:MAG: hypothetical protein EP332_10670 [Bacteroidetes bacterium]|nr:MAG: hypothetical protein EP332_10670 [Bacteroidota bacterium]
MKTRLKWKVSLWAMAAVSAIFFLQSCKPEIPPTKGPVRYEIDDFIFNTFLFSMGSWWALVDTVSGDRDTLMITESVAQHQNVYEGSEFKFYRFYYNSRVWSTSAQKSWLTEYLSNSYSTIQDNSYPQFQIYKDSKIWNFYLNGSELGDSLLITAAVMDGVKKENYFTVQGSGDSLLVNGKWRLGKYKAFKHSNVPEAEFVDQYYVFQEHFGLVSFKSDGSHYVVENSELFPVIR